MAGRNSDSRRRRLLQRGLIGSPASHPIATEDDLPESASFDDFNHSVTPVDRATRSFLESKTAASETNDTSVQDSHGEIAVSALDCGAGLATIKSLLAGNQPLTWVFTGDNTIQGAFYTEGHRGSTEIFSERLRAELRRSMDIVVNTGISGDTVAYSLATLTWRVLRFKPDVVVVSVGLNDAKAGAAGLGRFQRQMRELLDKIRTHGAIPLIILPHPVATSAMTNRQHLAEYVQSLQQVALRDEVPVVDHWNFWLKHWPSQAATRKRLHDGRLHLNGDAHRQLAAMLFETLGIYDPDSQSCKGTIRPDA